MLNTIYMFTSYLNLLYIWMIWVGLMGGSSYVNVMYLILEGNSLKKSQKELALTLCTAGNDFGILFASLLSLVLANTAFSNN